MIDLKCDQTVGYKGVSNIACKSSLIKKIVPRIFLFHSSGAWGALGFSVFSILSKRLPLVRGNLNKQTKKL